MFTIRYLVLYLALDGPVSAFLWQTPPKEACQPNAGSKGCVTSIGRRTSARSLSCRLVLLAGGFGASGDNKSPASKASGSAEAKAALRSSNGDLDRATSIVFRERLAKLQEGDSELADMLNSMLAAGERFLTYFFL